MVCRKKSRVSPDPIKRTVGEIVARGAGPANIKHRQAEKQTKEESSRVYQCKG